MSCDAIGMGTWTAGQPMLTPHTPSQQLRVLGEQSQDTSTTSHNTFDSGDKGGVDPRGW